MEQEEFNLKDRFFNLLTLLKYVLESKASVPFPKGENTRPYRKPMGYDIYDSNNDRDIYNKLSKEKKIKSKKKIKRYHYLRSHFDPIVMNLLKIVTWADKTSNEGQLTISFKLFSYLIEILKRYDNIDVIYNKINYVYTVPKNLGELMINKTVKKKSFLKKIIVFFKHFFQQRTVGYLYEVIFKSDDASFSITAVIYSENGKFKLLSFLKMGVNDIKNGEKLFKKMEIEIDSIIRTIPLSYMI